MKKQNLFFLLLIVTSVLNAQLKVNPLGNIELGTSPSTDCKLNLKGNSSLDGSVGIGVAPSTSYKLNILGNSKIVGNATFENSAVFVSSSSQSSFGPALVACGNNGQPAALFFNNYSGGSPYALEVEGDAYSWGSWEGSDLQLKNNVSNLDGKLMLSKIMNLNGKMYEFKTNKELEQIFKNIPTQENEYSHQPKNLPQGERYGFIAQEIEEEFPELVKTDPKTNLKAINYDGMIPILLQSIKEQQKMIIELQEKINNVNVTPKQSLLRSSSNINETESSSNNTISQNTPNPFTNSTIINYYITKETQNAMICIYNMNGNQLKSYTINERGNGNITIKGSELNAGIYLNALIVDGKEIDIKKMILTI